MAYLNALIALLPYFKKLMDLFIKTPEDKREDLRKVLDNAFDKFLSGDPSDLSKLINS